MDVAKQSEAARHDEAKGKMEAVWKEKSHSNPQGLMKVTHYYLNVRKLLIKLNLPSDKTLVFRAEVAEPEGELSEGFGKELNVNLEGGQEGGRISKKMRKERNRVPSPQPDVSNPGAVNDTRTSSAPVEPAAPPPLNQEERIAKIQAQFGKPKEL